MGGGVVCPSIQEDGHSPVAFCITCLTTFSWGPDACPWALLLPHASSQPTSHSEGLVSPCPCSWLTLSCQPGSLAGPPGLAFSLGLHFLLGGLWVWCPGLSFLVGSGA